MSTKKRSYNWKRSEQLSEECRDDDFASVGSLLNSPLRELFEKHIKVGHYVEYEQDGLYRTAKICQIAGYFLKLRWVGTRDLPRDRWVHIADPNLHEVGYLLSRETCTDESTVSERPQNQLGPSIPRGLSQLIEEQLKSKFKVGMNLEAINPKCISKLKPVKIIKIIGHRLQVEYQLNADGVRPTFWFHEASPLIHPVGFAGLIGLELDANTTYKQASFRKAITDKYSDYEASWKLFRPPTSHDEIMGSIKVGMKLEALDHTQPSKIVPATVKNIYRCSFLLIALDNRDKCDWFSCHMSYPYIFPVGFCLSNDIELSPPPGYKGQFSWNKYLEEKKAQRVPEICFKREESNHGIKVGQYLEAADSIEPNYICPAEVVEVKGNLIKIHFLGWSDNEYDQWVDCQSDDIFPIGWCELTKYHLERPHASSDDEQPVKKKLKVK